MQEQAWTAGELDSVIEKGKNVHFCNGAKLCWLLSFHMGRSRLGLPLVKAPFASTLFFEKSVSGQPGTVTGSVPMTCN